MVDQTLENFNVRYIFIFIVFVISGVSSILYLNSIGYQVKSVNIKVAKNLIHNGASIIDAREFSKYLSSHIPGAISVPLDTLKREIPDIINFPKSKYILVYGCTGSSSGLKATYILNKMGFVNAVNLESGICGWKKSKLPIEKSVQSGDQT